jgi:nicotinamide mononucleotide adenylyltransferase
MKRKYAMFIGRWQTWHAGHEWLINQQLNKGKNVWVAIRDVEVDENNPKSAHQVLMDLSKESFFIKNSDKIMISIIPDIESVNYGRGVGMMLFITTHQLMWNSLVEQRLEKDIWIPTEM